MVTNRITKLFENKTSKILSIFVTAGYPNLADTLPVLEALERAGTDMVELGIPFSDPLADGPVIQGSSEIALRNGMNLRALFEQLEGFREKISMPVLLMGYLNPVLQYGMEAFLAKCAEVGVDGLIIPDLPLAQYVDEYKSLFEDHNLCNILLITPQTSVERIKEIDLHSSGFIYAVSTAAVTGGQIDIDAQKIEYFKRISGLRLSNPLMVGFGISDKKSFDDTVQYVQGGIIGSAYVKALAQGKDVSASTSEFISSIKKV